MFLFKNYMDRHTYTVHFSSISLHQYIYLQCLLSPASLLFKSLIQVSMVGYLFTFLKLRGLMFFNSYLKVEKLHLTVKAKRLSELLMLLGEQLSTLVGQNNIDFLFHKFDCSFHYKLMTFTDL